MCRLDPMYKKHYSSQLLLLQSIYQHYTRVHVDASNELHHSAGLLFFASIIFITHFYEVGNNHDKQR